MTEVQQRELPPRAGSILIGLVNEYIRTAKPVGSTQLVETLRLDLSPATVRNIFRLLEDENYVLQPHTSAGRVPTDRGYRYYVDEYKASELSRLKQKRIAALIADYQQRFHSPAQIIAKALAESTGTVAVSGWLQNGEIRQAGLAALARQFPVETAHEALELLDDLDEIVEKFSEYDTPVAQVYIGGENPVVPTKYTSVLLRTIHSDGQEITLMLLGPKRMQYRQNVAWLNNVASYIEEDWDYDV